MLCLLWCPEDPSYVNAGCDRQPFRLEEGCNDASGDSSSILSRATPGADLLSPWWPPWCNHRSWHPVTRLRGLDFFFLLFFPPQSPAWLEKKTVNACFLRQWSFYHYSSVLPLISCAGPAKRPKCIQWGARSLRWILITTFILMTYFHADSSDAN